MNLWIKLNEFGVLVGFGWVMLYDFIESVVILRGVNKYYFKYLDENSKLLYVKNSSVFIVFINVFVVIEI